MHPEPSQATALAQFVSKDTMHKKKTYSIPHLTPQFSVCPNGCIHLQIGPASLHVTSDGLREFCQAAEGLLASMPAPPKTVVADKDLH
tara:strand:- start:14044 stop:14307 length:264 start_codon:yes stop_codon:yes gene_type:complete